MATNGISEEEGIPDGPSNFDKVLNYIREFTSAQATRTALYHEFESAVNDHANGSISLPEIVQVIRISQEGFNEASMTIIQQEKLLEEIGQTTLASIIRKLQSLEEEKLKVVTKLLSKRIEANDNTEVSFDSEVEELTARRQSIIEAVNDVMREAHEEILDINAS
ncbi:hypothetical protein V1514DRAFT_323925 [Lipomyces japonicus]|uniref:uncharacterized protein n=1 Tax=Lipomyces japonicus TaxID=56871 RepID=UPI0034CEC8D5